jgi:hypothetical protein
MVGEDAGNEKSERTGARRRGAARRPGRGVPRGERAVPDTAFERPALGTCAARD